VDVTTRWPLGTMETFEEVAAKQCIVVREGKGIAERDSSLLPYSRHV